MKKVLHSLVSKIVLAVFLFATFGGMTACGCGKSDSAAEEKVTISLSKTEIEITEGETYRLTVKVTPADAKDKTVTWRVSDKTVAGVTEGVVTALKAGETVVTAATGEKTATCKVKVKARPGNDPSSDKDSASPSDSGADSGSAAESGSASTGEETKG